MNFRKYMGIILNIVVPLAIIYAVCVWGLRLVVFFLPFDEADQDRGDDRESAGPVS